MKKSLYDLQNAEDNTAVLHDLRGFWKFWSACFLADSGLPSLRGLIIVRQGSSTKEQIKKFSESIGSKIFLVRHDKSPESPPYPRGGFLVGERLLNETIEYFFSLGRIVVLYEPADPLLNGYNINLLFENNHEIKVEVVGPGFDMSDLKRGDLSPHESFLIDLTPDNEISRVKLLNQIDGRAYMESVKERKIKIEQKLYSAPEQNLAHKIQEDLGVSKPLENYLKKIGSPLYNSQSYQPISVAILRETVETIVKSGVIDAYPKLTETKFPFVFSTSFVNNGQRQVFWDIVSPSLKFRGL